MNTYRLSHYGLIRISGIDATKFLQGQVTCDVREVTDQQSRLGAHCDVKGRVQVTFRLFKFNEDYYLLLLKNLIDHTLKLLNKYAVFSKVKLEDISEQWSIIGLSGTLTDMPTNIDAATRIENCVVIRVPSATPRCIIIGENANLQKLQQQLANELQTAEIEAWELLDIQAGIPTIYPETIGLFTPHDINYPQINGVSFNKGCYTGQEIIARMQFLGKLKQHLYRIQFAADAAPAIGTPLVDDAGHSVGTIIKTAAGSAQHFEALAVLQDKALTSVIRIANAAQTIVQLCI